MTNAASRSQRLDQLANNQFDLIVLGAGATGLAIALEASHRGYSVALIDRADISSGTSSRSTKLLHGGVRYLAKGQIALVKEALLERHSLIQLAPKRTKSIRFILPTRNIFYQGFYGLGLSIYERLAGSKSLGSNNFLSQRQLNRDFPHLTKNGFSGAITFLDGQFDDSGLALSMARACVKHDVVLATYVEASALIREGERVIGVQVKDLESDCAFQIRGDCVVNATGVWVDQFRNQPPMVSPSQGTHVIVDSSFSPPEDGIIIPKTSDGRVLFVVPWMGKRIIGTTDVARRSEDLHLRDVLPSSSEISWILSESRQVLCRPITRDDILSAWCGLRPLVSSSNQEMNSTSSLSREHTIEVTSNGLITITGGKWTTCLAMARDLLRKVQALNWVDSPSMKNGTSLMETACKRFPDDEPDCASRAPTEEEALWFLEHGFVRNLEDLLVRRSRLLLLDIDAAIKAGKALAKPLESRLGRDAGLDAFVKKAESWKENLRSL